jgi:hypothetical protein
MEFKIQPSPVLRTGKTAFPGGVSNLWTPSITFATPGNLTLAVTDAAGAYTRVGDLVFAYFVFRITPTFTSSSGDLRITGLPYSALEISQLGGAGWKGSSGTVSWLTGSQIVRPEMGVAQGAKYFRLRKADTLSVQASDITSGALLTIGGDVHYRAENLG